MIRPDASDLSRVALLLQNIVMTTPSPQGRISQTEGRSLDVFPRDQSNTYRISDLTQITSLKQDPRFPDIRAHADSLTEIQRILGLQEPVTLSRSAMPQATITRSRSALRDDSVTRSRSNLIPETVSRLRSALSEERLRSLIRMGQQRRQSAGRRSQISRLPSSSQLSASRQKLPLGRRKPTDGELLSTSRLSLDKLKPMMDIQRVSNRVYNPSDSLFAGNRQETLNFPFPVSRRRINRRLSQEAMIPRRSDKTQEGLSQYPRVTVSRSVLSNPDILKSMSDEDRIGHADQIISRENTVQSAVKSMQNSGTMKFEVSADTIQDLKRKLNDAVESLKKMDAPPVKQSTGKIAVTANISDVNKKGQGIQFYDPEFVPGGHSGSNVANKGENGGGDLSHHWSYKGAGGPGNWSSLYPTCSGTRQSPVNLKDRNIIYQDLPPFHFNNFDGRGGSFTLTNNGHTASISVVGNMTVEGGGLDGQYKTAELHFHWGSSNNYGSEHSINGRKYPLEMHIVNYATKYGNLSNAMKYRDGLAVLGTFYDVTEENPYFRPIENGLRVAQYAGNYTGLHPINLLGLLPRDTTRFYRYYGSLTTPPCFQSVMWTLFEDVQHLSPYQIQLLRQLYESHHDSHDHHSHQHGGHGFRHGHGMKAALPVAEYLMDNFRPIQPDFDRVINCNIPRYADPNFIRKSRQQASAPQRNDFISQRISQLNMEDLLNKTIQKWLVSKGLSTNILTPDHLSPQTSHLNLAHPGGFHNTRPQTPPDQLDLQVIQTQRMGPNGEQVSEIQVQVDSASGISQEQLQSLLKDPSIMEQIRKIVNSQGQNNHTHEILISPTPQMNQGFWSSQNTQRRQQFNSQTPVDPHHPAGGVPQGPTVMSSNSSSDNAKNFVVKHSITLTLDTDFADTSKTNTWPIPPKVYTVTLHLDNPSSLTSPSQSIHRDVFSSARLTPEHLSRSFAHRMDSSSTKRLPRKHAELPHHYVSSAAGIVQKRDKTRSKTSSIMARGPKKTTVEASFPEKNHKFLFPSLGVGNKNLLTESKVSPWYKSILFRKLDSTKVLFEDTPARVHHKLNFDHMHVTKSNTKRYDKNAFGGKLEKRLKRAVAKPSAKGIGNELLKTDITPKSTVLNMIKSFIDTNKKTSPVQANHSARVKYAQRDPLITYISHQVIHSPAASSKKSSSELSLAERNKNATVDTLSVVPSSLTPDVPSAANVAASPTGTQLESPVRYDYPVPKSAAKKHKKAKHEQVMVTGIQMTTPNGPSANTPGTTDTQTAASGNNSYTLSSVTKRQAVTSGQTVDAVTDALNPQTPGISNLISVQHTFNTDKGKAVKTTNTVILSTPSTIAIPNTINVGHHSQGQRTTEQNALPGSGNVQTATKDVNTSIMSDLSSSGSTSRVPGNGVGELSQYSKRATTSTQTNTIVGRFDAPVPVARSKTINTVGLKQIPITIKSGGSGSPPSTEGTPATAKYGGTDPATITEQSAGGSQTQTSGSSAGSGSPAPADNYGGAAPTTGTEQSAVNNRGSQMQTSGSYVGSGSPAPTDNYGGVAPATGTKRSAVYNGGSQTQTSVSSEGSGSPAPTDNSGGAAPATGTEQKAAYNRGSQTQTSQSSVGSGSPAPTGNYGGVAPATGTGQKARYNGGSQASGSSVGSGSPAPTDTYSGAAPTTGTEQSAVYNGGSQTQASGSSVGSGSPAPTDNYGGAALTTGTEQSVVYNRRSQMQTSGSSVGSGSPAPTDTYSGAAPTTGTEQSAVYNGGSQTQASGSSVGSGSPAPTDNYGGAAPATGTEQSAVYNGGSLTQVSGSSVGSGSPALTDTYGGAAPTTGTEQSAVYNGGSQTQASGFSAGSGSPAPTDNYGGSAPPAGSIDLTAPVTDIQQNPVNAGGSQTPASGPVAGSGASTSTSNNGGTTPVTGTQQSGVFAGGSLEQATGPAVGPLSTAAGATSGTDPSTSSSKTESMPFDAQGYFNYDLADKRSGWSLHSLKKTPSPKQGADYTESFNIDSNAFDMAMMGSGTADAMDAFESSRKTYTSGSNDVTGIYDSNQDPFASSQPGPGETSVISRGFDGGNPVGLQNILQTAEQPAAGEIFGDSLNQDMPVPGRSSTQSYFGSRGRIGQNIEQTKPIFTDVSSLRTDASFNNEFQSVDTSSSSPSYSIEHNMFQGSSQLSSGLDIGNLLQDSSPTIAPTSLSKYLGNGNAILSSGNRPVEVHGQSSVITRQSNAVPSVQEPLEYAMSKTGTAFSDQNPGGILPIDQPFLSTATHSGMTHDQRMFDQIPQNIGLSNGNILMSGNLESGSPVPRFRALSQLNTIKTTSILGKDTVPGSEGFGQNGVKVSGFLQNAVQKPLAPVTAQYGPSIGKAPASSAHYVTNTVNAGRYNSAQSFRGRPGQTSSLNEVPMISNQVTRQLSRSEPALASSPTVNMVNKLNPKRDNSVKGIRGATTHTSGRVHPLDSAYRTSHSIRYSQSTGSNVGSKQSSKRPNVYRVDSAYRVFPEKRTGTSHVVVRNSQNQLQNRQLMNSRFSSPLSKRNTKPNSQYLANTPGAVPNRIMPRNTAQSSRRSASPLARQSSNTVKRPANTAVYINQQNRHVNNQVNSGMSNIQSRPSSRFSSRTGRQVQVGPNGQMSNRNLPVGSGRGNNIRTQRTNVNRSSLASVPQTSTRRTSSNSIFQRKRFSVPGTSIINNLPSYGRQFGSAVMG